LMSSMSSKRKRNLGKSTLVKGAKAANVKRALCV
jgi:ribosomal protein L35